uniref:Uncharacterized protein n=1 Tax=Anguilla anguilla TaxID=7936 RepID=A0A0E9P599_ANGAN
MHFMSALNYFKKRVIA